MVTNLPLPTLNRELPDAAATEATGAALASILTPGLHIQLHGELGAGKTTFVRGLLRALGHTGPVKSPTYALVEEYVFPLNVVDVGKNSKIYFYHFDFYRFSRESEWLDAGFKDYFGPHAICAVEWPEHAGDLLPAPDLHVRLSYADEARHLDISAPSPAGAACLARLEPLLSPPRRTT